MHFCSWIFCILPLPINLTSQSVLGIVLSSSTLRLPRILNMEVNSTLIIVFTYKVNLTIITIWSLHTNCYFNLQNNRNRYEYCNVFKCFWYSFSVSHNAFSICYQFIYKIKFKSNLSNTDSSTELVFKDQ